MEYCGVRGAEEVKTQNKLNILEVNAEVIVTT